MALTKLTFYISLITVVLFFFVSIASVGTDFLNTDRLDLNEQSVDYIAEVKGVSSDSGFDSVASTDSAESFDKGILDSEDDRTVDDNLDFLATLQIKKERASQSTNFFKLTYNIPSSLLIGLGLPLSEFRDITNIIGFIIFISLIIMVWTKLINT